MKNTTPMQVMKPLLTQFKNLQGFTCIELNGKKGGYTFVGRETYHSNPVTFDYVVILGFGGIYHDLGFPKRFVNTIALSFSYTNRKTPVVRAGVSHRNKVDYSAEFDVDTMKGLLKVFLESPTAERFVSIFNILQSSKLDNAAIRQFKAPYVEKANGLKSKIEVVRESLRTKTNHFYDLQRKSDGNLEKVRKEIAKLNDELDVLQKELNYIFNEDTKNMPHVVRYSFNKEMEQLKIRYS